jgi:hypothetical protein
MVGAETLTCALTVANSPSSTCRVEGGHKTFRRGSLRVSPGLSGSLRVSSGFFGFLRVSSGFFGFLRVSSGFFGFLREFF